MKKLLLFLLLLPFALLAQQNPTAFPYGVKIGQTPFLENNTKAANMSRSTGLYSFAGGGITAASSTTFNVGAVNGFIQSSATPATTAPIAVAYPGGTGLTTPYLLTAPATYILVQSNNTLLYLNVAPTVTQRRNNIFLGVIGHPAGTITGIGNSPDICLNEMSQVRAMFEPTRLINEGVFVYANSTNLTLANTSGTLYGFGIGFIANGNDAPSILNVAAGAPMTTQYRTQGTTTFPNTTVADPLNYDVAGVQTAIPGSSNQATNQRFYLLENGMIRIQYGQTIYPTLTDAIAAASNESFVVNVNAKKLGILIGILSIEKGCTNLSLTADARFLPVSKFGETVGAAAGIAIGTLQNAYNNSTDPEIVTNSTLDGFTVRRGSAADTDNVIVGQNGAGTNTFEVTGNGKITAPVDATISGVTVGKGAGSSTTAMGSLALEFNTGSQSNGFGLESLQNNTGSACNGFGFVALENNTGIQSSGFGHGVMQNNSAASSNGLGYRGLQYNAAASSNGFGYEVLQYNIGLQSSGFGDRALQYNSGAQSSGFGYRALRYNQSVDNNVFGHNSYSTFMDNVPGAKTVTPAEVDIALDRITITAHGLGATNAYVNLRYTVAGSVIGGLANNEIYQAQIIDANTIYLRANNLTSTGSGSHTFTPQTTYTNVNILGTNIQPTASNQTIIGTTATTHAIIRGRVLVGTTTDNGVDGIQVAGTVSGSAATLSNQFITKGQADFKADLSSPVFTGSPTAPTAAFGTNTTQIATTAFVQSKIPYNSYVIDMTQSATSNPVANVVFENGLGSITLTRTGVGTYAVNSSGMFIGNKTFITISNNKYFTGTPVFVAGSRTSNNVVELTSYLGGTLTDNIFNQCQIEIRVYN